MGMARYRVTLHVLPVGSCRPLNGRDPLTASRVVEAPCAQRAACELARPYIDAGLTVDWSVRRSGVRRLGRHWQGRFTPDGDDGLGGVREPRRPYPPIGSATATIDPAA